MATSKTAGVALDGTEATLSYALSKRTSIGVAIRKFEVAGQAKDNERNRVSLNHSF